MFQSEINVNKRITEATLEKNKKLIEEITHLKQIIKVPRLHFKQVEKSDWDTISKQYDEVLMK